MSRYIDADALKIPSEEMIAKMIIDSAPSIEPNRILPERMERGDIYEVGETIVVMNHDDYYDLLCKSWVPKRGEWIVYEGGWKDFDYYPPKCKCNQCGYEEELYILNAKPTNYCPNCGADMREEGE